MVHSIGPIIVASLVLSGSSEPLTHPTTSGVFVASFPRIQTYADNKPPTGKQYHDTLKPATADTVIPPFLGESLRYGVDTSVHPCNDFYQYVNGAWRARTQLGQVPPGRGRSITALKDTYRRIQTRIHALIDSAQTVAVTTVDPTLKVIGTFYGSCLTADSADLVPRYGPPSRGLDSHDRASFCVQQTLSSLSVAVGQAFARELLTPDVVLQMETLLKSLQTAAIARLKRNPWMSQDERTIGVERLEKLRLRIGMPDELIDFSTLAATLTDDYKQNNSAITAFDNRQWIASIGGDTREKWKSSLMRTNASYSAGDHSIEVPAAMFLPPFFDATQDAALNYAGIGIVIGHEIFHSIAQQLRSIENPEMEKNIARFQESNSQFGTLDGWSSDGKRTFQEDIADLGGVLVAYDAWKATSRTHNDTSSLTIDGYSPDQRFFLGVARIWRAKWKGSGFGGVHAAPFARVYTMIMNSPQFAPAFGCKDGDPMVLDKQYKIAIW